MNRSVPNVAKLSNNQVDMLYERLIENKVEQSLPNKVFAACENLNLEPTACWIVPIDCSDPKLIRNQKQYQWVRLAGSGVNYLAHHISFLKKSGEHITLNQTDISHRCDNPSCFNPQHLELVSRRANHSRKNCVLAVKCQCGLFVRVCKHEPHCLTI